MTVCGMLCGRKNKKEIGKQQNHRKYNNRTGLAGAVLILILCILTGCIPNNFTKEEKLAFLEEAKAAASDYLEDRYSGAVIKEIQPETIVKEGGYELTEFASGQFEWQKQNYDFLVNTETGEVYTSVRLKEIEEKLREEVLRALDVSWQEEALYSCSIYYLSGSSVPELKEAFRNVFPENQSAEELVRKILQDTEEYKFSLEIQYKGAELPQGIMEMEAPFPTLSDISLYHIAEEHALYEGEYGYSVLPSLSEEVLQIIYWKDTADYTRNQVLEQAGFRVVYNAYVKTINQETVTEAVIAEEDIILTVTDESIDLDCTKADYCMYLSTTDKRIAKKYLYAFTGNAMNKGEIEEGMWYPFEDSYIYADNIYVETPHEFEPRNRVQNTIYTKSASKRLS